MGHRRQDSRRRKNISGLQASLALVVTGWMGLKQAGKQKQALIID
jgi:hypothetical protein